MQPIFSTNMLLRLAYLVDAEELLDSVVTA